MSQTPGEPEYYQPPSQATPTPPPPPSISDAAQQWGQAQDGSGAEIPEQYAPPAPGPAGYVQAGYPQQYAQPGYAQPGYAQQYGYAPPPGAPKAPQGLAITALVLGIVAFVTGWAPVFGTIIGVLAVLFGVIALAKKQSKGMALTGLVLGFIGAVASVLMLIFVLRSADNFADEYEDWSTYPPTTEDQTALPVTPDGTSVSVTETAFGTFDYDDASTWYVVILDNESGVSYGPTDLTVEALDASGNVIDSSWTYATLPTGSIALTGSFWKADPAEIASLNVVGPAENDFQEWDLAGSATVEGLTAQDDDYWTTVSGTFVSDLDQDVIGPQVNVVARDASGQIIGSATAWLETVSPGGSQDFDAMFYSLMPESTQYEAYWTSY
ncbi:FxLYD domain-containing protein [Demequina sp.]|uniref:FxLYD domain-containing protein n=1 Tax=Demequina sp. TaxID=2050685 RepID=UPI003D117645